MPTVNQSQTARILGISRRTVKRRIEAGELASVDTPDGPMVVLDDEPAPTLPTGHAHYGAHQVPTPELSDKLSPTTEITTDNLSPVNSDLAARLERAESRIDRLLGIVDEQNRTIQAQTIRLAQLEHRMIDAAPPETPTEPQERSTEPRYTPCTNWRPQRAVHALEGWALGMGRGWAPLGMRGHVAALQKF